MHRSGTKTMKITLEHYEKTFTAEMSNESTLDEVMETFVNLLVCSGYPKFELEPDYRSDSEKLIDEFRSVG